MKNRWEYFIYQFLSCHYIYMRDCSPHTSPQPLVFSGWLKGMCTSDAWDFSINPLLFIPRLVFSYYQQKVFIGKSLIIRFLFVYLYCIVGFFREDNFHKFHKSIAIWENFTLKVFTSGINKIALFEYFKVDIHVKEPI